ncbi:hypothetical protein ACC839_18285, partial [Rhizobium ruizarguesonis]
SPAAMLNHIQTDLRIPDSAKSQHALVFANAKTRRIAPAGFFVAVKKPYSAANGAVRGGSAGMSM